MRRGLARLVYERVLNSETTEAKYDSRRATIRPSIATLMRRRRNKRGVLMIRIAPNDCQRPGFNLTMKRLHLVLLAPTAMSGGGRLSFHPTPALAANDELSPFVVAQAPPADAEKDKRGPPQGGRPPGAPPPGAGPRPPSPPPAAAPPPPRP